MRPRVEILTTEPPRKDNKKSAERERDDQANAAAHMRCVWQQRRAKQNPAIQQNMEPGKFFAMRERQHRPAGARAALRPRRRQSQYFAAWPASEGLYKPPRSRERSRASARA